MYPQHRQFPTYEAAPQFNPMVQLSPRRVPFQAEEPPLVSPPRVPIDYDDFELTTVINPPRMLKMPERVTTLPPPIVYRSPEPEAVTLTDLPRDVLIELLINLPPGRLFDLCGTSSALSRLCNDESFLRNLIVRKYGVSINMIPGQTIKEKYAFISQFDPRYFTDPDFVRISNYYREEFGGAYSSRETPNDALNTITSILNDSQTVEDINVMYPRLRGHVPGGHYSLRLKLLLSGAVLTKNRSFVRQIISVAKGRIPPEEWARGYINSFRYPLILAIEYELKEIIELLTGDHDFEWYRFREEAMLEIMAVNSIEVFKRFIPYLEADEQLFRGLVSRKRYELADYVLINLSHKQQLSTAGRYSNLTLAIRKGDIDEVRYFLKYRNPLQEHIDQATRLGRQDIVRVLQGLPEIEEDLDE